MAGPTVTILGQQSQQQVEQLLARCRAYVYAGLEDFGIAPVEAMASGAPVIGLGHGGLLDTVRCAASGMADATGVLFPDQTVDSLTEAVRWFERRQLWQVLDAAVLRQWAERFRLTLPSVLTQFCRGPGRHISNAVYAASDPVGMRKL